MRSELERALSPDERALLERLGPGLDVLAGLRDEMLAGRMSAESNRIRGEVCGPATGDVQPIPDDPQLREELQRVGAEALREGHVGLLLLNGGMATRFGGVVKGTVTVAGDRSFLAFKLQDAQRVAARFGAPAPPVILMNSIATDGATRTHLEAHDFFGFPPARVRAFVQQWTMRLRPDGLPLLDGEGRPSFYGPGHGDLPECMRRSGELARFRAGGGRVLLMSNVDNVLATLDPVLVGWHLRRAASITVELAEKEPGDAGGTPARVDGRPQIVESFRFPVGFDQDAIPVLNTNTLWLDAEALAREAELTWFMVRKEVDGAPAVQFERLVGELTAHVPTAFLRVPRSGPDGRFYPVKRPEDLELGRDELMRLWEARGSS